MPKMPERGGARTLNDIRPGGRVRIQRHHSSGAVRQRLLDLGLMPNVVVTVVRSAPLNDPIELKLDASSITLRRREAITIEVTHEEIREATREEIHEKTREEIKP